jgi:TonB family protein
MKLIHLALGVAAASVLPSAAADEPVSPKPFTLTLTSDLSPASKPDLRYPSHAGMQGLGGACDMSFTVSTEGKADAIRVSACTSDVFRRAAKKAVEDMSFAPRSTPLDNARMRIQWTLNESQVSTASLN